MIENIILPGVRSVGNLPLVAAVGPSYDRFQWQNTFLDVLDYFVSTSFTVALSQAPYPSKQLYVAKDIRREWNKYVVRQATKNGVPAFWIPKSTDVYSKLDPSTNTKVLLQQWYQRSRLAGDKFVLGIAPGNPEHDALRHRFSTHCPSVTLCDSLDETAYAVSQALSKK